MAVKFIRKNGRVIPIDDERRAKRLKQVEGVGSIAAGAAVGSISGRAASNNLVKAMQYDEIAGKYGDAARKAYKTAARGLKGSARAARQAGQFSYQAGQKYGISKQLRTDAVRYQNSGVVVGGGLIGFGVQRLLPEKYNKHPSVNIGVSIAAGAAVSAGLKKVYRAKVGIKDAAEVISKAAKYFK